MPNENTRIYAVSEGPANGETGRLAIHLVRATSQAQAIRHVVTPKYRADVASQEQLVQLLGAGVQVQDATAT